MRIDLVLLTVAYVLSQFYRAFLAVLSGVLERDIGATAQDLADASGLWFLTFAAMQIPVGYALDKIGPRRTVSLLMLIGAGGGSALFALAQSPAHVSIAMMLIGVGCSPVLMASYYIIARDYPGRAFAGMAAIVLGTGSFGNVLGAAPLAYAVEAVGWRGTLWGLALASAAIAIVLFFRVRDPAKAEGETKGGLLDILKIRALWLILPLCLFQYAPAAGLRGLWIGPYFRDAFALSETQLGTVTLVMALAMIAGTFSYGPADRIFGTRKWVVVAGQIGGLTSLALLFTGLGQGLWRDAVLFALIGFFGAAFPVMVAHGRSFIPDHLVGRGVTLLNLCGIGGVGLMQMVTGGVYDRALAAGGGGAVIDPYRAVLLAFALPLLAGLMLYLFSRDRVD